MFKLSHKYKQHSGPLYAVEFSEELNLLFSGGGDKVVATWDLDKQENTPFSIKTNSAVLNLRLINKQHLFVGLFNGNFHIIDINTRAEIKFFPYHKSGVFSSEKIEGKDLLFVGSGDGTISIWDTKEYTLIQNYKISEGKIRAIQQVNDSVYIGTSEGDVIKIAFNDLSNAIKVLEHSSSIYCLSKHKEKDALLIGDKDAHISVFDVVKNAVTLSIPAHNWPIYSIEWIGNEYFATCSRDKIVKIWDANNLEVIQRLSFPKHQGHINSINNLKYCSSREQLISIGDDKQICVWEKTN